MFAMHSQAIKLFFSHIQILRCFPPLDALTTPPAASSLHPCPWAADIPGGSPSRHREQVGREKQQGLFLSRRHFEGGWADASVFPSGNWPRKFTA